MGVVTGDMLVDAAPRRSLVLLTLTTVLLMTM
jgi:hypothetical protein